MERCAEDNGEPGGRRIPHKVGKSVKELRLKHSIVKRIIKECKSYQQEETDLRVKLKTIEGDRRFVSPTGEDLVGEVKRYTAVLADTQQMIPDAITRLLAAVGQLHQQIVEDEEVAKTKINPNNNSAVNGGSGEEAGKQNKIDPHHGGNSTLQHEVEAARRTLAESAEQFPQVAYMLSQKTPTTDTSRCNRGHWEKEESDNNDDNDDNSDDDDDDDDEI